MDDSQRKHEEAEFHDERELDRARLTPEEFEARYSNNKFYTVVRASTSYLDRWIAANAPSKVALDYCCGLGAISLRLAKAGATVHGFDISAESVKTARTLVRENNVSDRAHFTVMDAENLSFGDNKFDLIVVSGVLHHLDVDRAYPELARVLKPSGRILCMEALGYNPIINLYRRLTPKLRTAWETEHILTLREVTKARKFFDAVDVRFFHLASILAVPLRKTPLLKPALFILDLIDSIILRIPGFRRLAWQMFFELSKPRRA